MTKVVLSHYFNDNVQEARAERLRSALKGEAVAVEFDDETRHMVPVDATIHSVQMGNIEHTVEDIHAGGRVAGGFRGWKWRCSLGDEGRMIARRKGRLSNDYLRSQS